MGRQGLGDTYTSQGTPKIAGKPSEDRKGFSTGFTGSLALLTP